MSHPDSVYYAKGAKGAVLGIVSNVLLFAVKISAGIFGRSQAMIADAMHTASDALTSIVVLIGFKIAKKPADEHHPFGHGRAESIMAKIVSLVLIAVGLGIAFDSAKILLRGNIEEPRWIALAVAVLSVVVKELTYRRVISVGKEINSVSLKADAYHHRSDALSSLAAIVGIGGAMMGHTFMDPLAGIIVSGFIIKLGAEVFHQAYDELMDAAPPAEFKEKLNGIIRDVEGVKEIKRIMVRKTGIEYFLEAVIGVDGTISVEEGHRVTIAIKKNIIKEMPNVTDVVVHVEPCGESD